MKHPVQLMYFINHPWLCSQVTELEEMPPPGAAKGLRSWQSLRTSESRLLSSQPDPATVSFAQRLEQEPQLRFVLAGDGPCIITPVKAPPCRKVVAGWLEDKLESLQPAAEKGAPAECVQPMDGADADVEMTLPLDIDAPEEEREGASTRESSDDEDSMFTRLKDRRREVRLFSDLSELFHLYSPSHTLLGLRCSDGLCS